MRGRRGEGRKWGFRYKEERVRGRNKRERGVRGGGWG